ncbi:MAG TPA: helix-turn-helix transcriptional regulator [Kofleriaceae bacterium]|nr:helix-turn-helix transcriptional regulator [Kofleriaceae bacterium]
MPQFRITPVVATRDVTAVRALCDGCDPARPCDEHTQRASLWLLSRGAFELRDAAGRHLIDPTRAIAMPNHHRFQIRHPAGPDTCLSFRGPIVEALTARGARLLPVSAAQTARIMAALADPDELALAEALVDLVPSGDGGDHRGHECRGGNLDDRAHGGAGGHLGDGGDGGRREVRAGRRQSARPAAAADRDLSAAVADAVRARFAEPTSLGELADTAGYSVFHTCRVFRATTGFTIHGFRRELRLRHALARILDGGDSLTEIAIAAGFASQSHLTNLFRARFGVTPARARTRHGRDAIARCA